MVIDVLRKLMIWIGIAAVVILAVVLPVVVTGMFGGQPLAGSIALIGLVLLAFAVAWYVHTHREGR